MSSSDEALSGEREHRAIPTPPAPAVVAPVDALFAINQDSLLGALVPLCERRRHRSILVLATHHPLPPEATRIRKLAPEVRIFQFADLLDDEEAAAADDRATHECLLRLGKRGRRAYNAHFMAASLAWKNELAYRKLVQRYRPGAVYYSPGLGIHAPFWRSVGGLPIAPPSRPPLDLRRAGRLASMVAAPFRSATELTVVRAPAAAGSPRAFAFLGAIRRLRLADGCRVELLRDPGLGALWGLRATAPGLPIVARLLRRAIRRTVGPAPWELGTTIHEYRPSWSDLADALGVELHIFVDGHHPSNYPRSYIDSFLSGSFVVANVVSVDWFRRHGRRACPPRAFQKSEQFAECRCHELRTVVLSANHAGDWTALINRSDTDLLIQAFAELAERHPELLFRIRLHPTMAHPAHEGMRSVERIHRYIDGLALRNLAVSRAPLEEDLVHGDLFLSEYSQILIEAWRRGKLGLAVNLTGRRSFMHDYERLGFIGVPGLESLHQTIHELPTVLPEFVARQNRAVRRFNRLQRVWEGEARRGEGCSG